MTDSELHLFFEDLVRALHARGVICAITSGLACVHYRVAETTKAGVSPGSVRSIDTKSDEP